MLEEADIPPNINPQRLPPDERPDATAISSALYNLYLLVQDYEAALRLFDSAEMWETVTRKAALVNSCSTSERHLLSRWLFIAARDATMTVFHIGDALHGLGEAFRGCPTLSKVVDHDRLRRARKRFEASFPMYNAVRNAVSHRAETAKSGAKAERHRNKGEIDLPGVFGDVNVEHSLMNRTYTTAWNGVQVSSELNSANAHTLREIVREVFLAFGRHINEKLPEMSIHKHG